MSEQNVEEIPVVFPCQDDTLVGIIHRPQQPSSIGIVCVVAGGPQYRGGMGRNMVFMARKLASVGVAVMRFDHRGLGDSSGEFLGFEHTRDDIQAAVDCLRNEVPAVTGVVLWGGCDAASGCMIHGCDLQGVASMVLGNPWVTTAETQLQVRNQHYLQRLTQWSFWRKLLRFEYNPLDYAGGLMARLRPQPTSPETEVGSGGSAVDVSRQGHWVDRMRDGLRNFDGPILFLMSGQSLVSKEFDALVSSDKAWRAAYNGRARERIDLPDADQTFSSADARRQVSDALSHWVIQLTAKGAHD